MTVSLCSVAVLEEIPSTHKMCQLLLLENRICFCFCYDIIIRCLALICAVPVAVTIFFELCCHGVFKFSKVMHR